MVVFLIIFIRTNSLLYEFSKVDSIILSELRNINLWVFMVASCGRQRNASNDNKCDIKTINKDVYTFLC